jgi:hypothetical protein
MITDHWRGELREPRESWDGPSASQSSALHVAAHKSEDQIRFIVISFSSAQSAVLKEFQENLKKSIDTLLRVQLKGVPSPAFARSAAGEPNTGKNG